MQINTGGAISLTITAEYSNYYNLYAKCVDS